MQDAVSVFAKAFGENVTFINQYQINPSSCYSVYQNDEPSSSGRDLLAKIDEVNQLKTPTTKQNFE